jgi:hypothetical protein
MKSTAFRIALTSVLLAVSLSACVVYPARPAGGVVYDDEVAVTNVAPPPPQAEVVGVIPSPGYFWVGGVWFWEGGRHVWHPGHWQAPRAGYRWVPHTWVHNNGSWHLRGGRWEHH